MIEPYCRTLIEQFTINPLLEKMPQCHPVHVTLATALIGILIFPFVALGYHWIAVTLLILTGWGDMLDGSIARYHHKTSNYGAAIDIIADRVVECSIMLGLLVVDPTSRAIPIVCMFTATLLCITSFLVVAIFTENHTQKGFHYSKGIIERAEAFLFFGFMILLPSHFVTLAYLYTTLTLITTIKRVQEFKRFCKNTE